MLTPIILDSCLSILFFVGHTHKGYIVRHKRLQGYDEIDFDLICGLIARSTGVIFTPNTLTETSNLIRYLNGPIRSKVAVTLKAIVSNPSCKEIMIASRVATQRGEYLRLGLTDAVMLEVARSADATLLTIDLSLYLAACSAGLRAVNYNHIKEQRPDFQ